MLLRDTCREGGCWCATESQRSLTLGVCLLLLPNLQLSPLRAIQTMINAVHVSHLVVVIRDDIDPALLIMYFPTVPVFTHQSHRQLTDCMASAFRVRPRYFLCDFIMTTSTIQLGALTTASKILKQEIHTHTHTHTHIHNSFLSLLI